MLIPNVSKIVGDYLKNMKPAEAGKYIIEALKQFDRLPKNQQEEIRTLIKNIIE